MLWVAVSALLRNAWGGLGTLTNALEIEDNPINPTMAAAALAG